MAKKEDVTFFARIVKNETKGGAWLATVETVGSYYEDERDMLREDCDAFTNASAAKRWIKEKVLEMTPRKRVKLVPVETRIEKDAEGTPKVVPYVDAKGKYLAFQGSLSFKAEIEHLDEEDDIY